VTENDPAAAAAAGGNNKSVGGGGRPGVSATEAQRARDVLGTHTNHETAGYAFPVFPNPKNGGR
jgi:hypothetical protein